jgi:hypothetical protein
LELGGGANRGIVAPSITENRGTIDMSVFVAIDDALYAEAQARAQEESRTVAGQIEFWARVGKAALDNPDLPTDFVRDLLLAREEGRDQATPFVPEGRRG